jgi:hypothetical protein
MDYLTFIHPVPQRDEDLRIVLIHTGARSLIMACCTIFPDASCENSEKAKVKREK